MQLRKSTNCQRLYLCHALSLYLSEKIQLYLPGNLAYYVTELLKMVYLRKACMLDVCKDNL